MGNWVFDLPILLGVICSLAALCRWLSARWPPRSEPAAVPAAWLPEAVEINFGSDLTAAVQRDLSLLTDCLARLRGHSEIDQPVVRIRHDALLADRAYAVSVHGHRIAGRVVEEGADVIEELISTLGAAWQQYGEIIRAAAHTRHPGPLAGEGGRAAAG